MSGEKSPYDIAHCNSKGTKLSHKWEKNLKATYKVSGNAPYTNSFSKALDLIFASEWGVWAVACAHGKGENCCN